AVLDSDTVEFSVTAGQRDRNPHPHRLPHGAADLGRASPEARGIEYRQIEVPRNRGHPSRERTAYRGIQPKDARANSFVGSHAWISGQRQDPNARAGPGHKFACFAVTIVWCNILVGVVEFHLVV